MREGVNGVEVGGIGDGHGHLALGLENGNDAVFFRHVAGDDGDDIVLNLEVGQVNHFRTELGCLGLSNVTRTDDLVGHQQIHHAHAGGIGLLTRLGNLVGGDEAEVNQQVQ